MKTINDIVLCADSHHGVYIPHLVTKEYINDPTWDWSEVEQEDIDILLSNNAIEHEWYWGAWENVMDNVKVTDEHGTVYTLMYNEDLWLVPEDIDQEELENWII